MILVVDIDGTISDHSHRVHHVLKAPKNWDAYYGAMHLDQPIAAAQKALQMLSERHLTIYLLTGRPEEYREATTLWLNEHFPFLPYLPCMRPTGSKEPSWAFKERIVGPLAAKGEGIVFIDDDLRNQEMYARYGLFLKAPECWEVLR